MLSKILKKCFGLSEDAALMAVDITRELLTRQVGVVRDNIARASSLGRTFPQDITDIMSRIMEGENVGLQELQMVGEILQESLADESVHTSVETVSTFYRKFL